MAKLFFTFTHGDQKFEEELKGLPCESPETCDRQVFLTQPLCPKHLLLEFGVIVKSSPVHKLGLFTGPNTTFLRGWPIVPYTGKSCTEADVDARYGKESTAPYVVCVTPHSHYIDAALFRSAAAAANGAFNGITANAQLVNSLSVPQARSAIFQRYANVPWIEATTTIPPNTEIILNYGDEFTLQGDFKHDTFLVKS